MMSTSTTVDPSTTTEDPETTTGPFETTSTSGATTTGGTDAGSTSTGPGCIDGTEDCPCDEGMCEDGLDCVKDTCIDPLGCSDEPDTEPNDEETAAQSLPEADCGELESTMGGVDMGDVDWFTYHGVAQPNCGEDTIVILAEEPMSDLRVCMYFECDMGNAQVVCSGAFDEDTSEEGRPGCCGNGSVQYTSTNCLGAAMSDSGDIYISVEGPEEPMCVTYDLAYRFLD